MTTPGPSEVKLGKQADPDPEMPANPSIHDPAHDSAGVGPQDMPQASFEARMFHTRRGRHVTFEWLEDNMTLTKSTTYFECLVPLGLKFEIPVILIHGICHSSSVSSYFHKALDRKC